MTTITKTQVAKLNKLLDFGLPSGLGTRRKGRMCVQAAVSYAFGFEHGDHPACVDYSIAGIGISLNDSNWSSKKARADGLRRLSIAQLGTDGMFDGDQQREFHDLLKNNMSAMLLNHVVPAAIVNSLHKYGGHMTAVQRAILLNAAETCNVAAIDHSFRASVWASVWDSVSDSVRDSVSASVRASVRDSVSDSVSAISQSMTNPIKSAGDLACWFSKNVCPNMGDLVLRHAAEVVVQTLQDIDTPGSKYLYMAPKPEIPELF